MNYEVEYPNLFQFLGGYFHQDCMFDHNNSTEIIEYFLKNNDQQCKNKIKKEINRLLMMHKTDQELKEIIYKLGAFYDPVPDNMRTSVWLRELSKKMVI